MAQYLNPNYHEAPAAPAPDTNYNEAGAPLTRYQPTPQEAARFSMNPISRGIKAGMQHLGADWNAYKGQVQAALGSPAAAADDFKTAQGYQNNEAFWANPVQTLDQAQATGDYGDYVRNLVGTGLASSAPALVGSLALRGVRGGAFLGGTAGMFPQMAGDEVLAARANPHNANKSEADLLKEATGVGLGGAAAMAYLPTRLSGKLLGVGVKGGARGIGAAANEMANAGAEGAALSTGSTALSQAGQSYLDPQRDTRNDAAALKEAAVGGAVGALPFGAMGAAGELLHGNTRALGGKATDLAGQAVDAGRDLAGQAAAQAPAAVDAVTDAASTARDTAGQTVQDYGLPTWNKLKQYAQDQDWGRAASDAVDRFKQMTQRSTAPAAEAWLAGTTVPDDVRAQGVQAIMNYNKLNAPKRSEAARMMAGELVAARQVPDDVKQRIAAMHGDYGNQRHQQFIAQAHAAYQTGTDLGGRLDAVTRAINAAVGPTDSRKGNQALGYQMNEQYDTVDHAIADAMTKHLAPDHLDLPYASRLLAANAVRRYIEDEGQIKDHTAVAATLHHAMGTEAKPFMDMAHAIMKQAGLIDSDGHAPTRAALDRASKNAKGFHTKVKGIISKYLNPALIPHYKTSDLNTLADGIAAFFRGDGSHRLDPDANRAREMQFLGNVHALFGLHTDAAMQEIYAAHNDLTGTMAKDTISGRLADANKDVSEEDDGGFRHADLHDYEADRSEHTMQERFHLPHEARGWESKVPVPHMEYESAREYGNPTRTDKTMETLRHFYPNDHIERASGLDWTSFHGHDPDEVAQAVIAEQQRMDAHRPPHKQLAPRLQRLLQQVGPYEFLHEHTDAIRRTFLHDDPSELSDHDLAAMAADSDKLSGIKDGAITVLDRLGRKHVFSAMSITQHMLGKEGGRFTQKDFGGLTNEMLGNLFTHGLARILDDPRFRRAKGEDALADTTGRELVTGKDGVLRFPDDMLITRRNGHDVRYKDIKAVVEPALKKLVKRQNHENQIEADHRAHTATEEKPQGESLRARADAAIAKMRQGAAFTKRNGDVIPAGPQAAAYRKKMLEGILDREQSPATEMLRLRMEHADGGIMARTENWGEDKTYQGEGLEDQTPTAHNYEDIVREDGRERTFDPNFNGETVQPRQLVKRTGDQPWDPALDNRERDKDVRRGQYAQKLDDANRQYEREPVDDHPNAAKIEKLSQRDAAGLVPDEPGIEHVGQNSVDWEDVHAEQPPSPKADAVAATDKAVTAQAKANDRAKAANKLESADPFNGKYNEAGTKAHPNPAARLVQTLKEHAAAQEAVRKEMGLNDAQRQYAKTGLGPTPMDATTRAKIKDYIGRVLGNAVKLAIRKDLGHTGDFSVQDGLETIRLSSLAMDPMQAAFHEAFHAFANRLQADAGGRKLYATLEKAATGDFVQGQLKKLLKNEKDALKQLQDPAEAMAYMYQFWAARDERGEPMLQLGPKADGLFARISQFFDKVRRILRGDPNAEDILSYFHSGEFQTEYAVGLDTATLHHIAAYTQAARDSGSVKGLKKATEGLYKIFATADARMRDMKIPEFTQIADLMHTEVGAKHKDMGYLQAKMQKGDQYLTRLNRIFDGFQRDDAAAILAKLHDNQADVKLNGKQQAAVKQVQALLDDMYDYMKAAGMDLNYTGTERQAYFPRVWDTDYIMAHPDAFRAMLEHYERNHKLAPGATDGIMQRLLQTNGFDDITEGENRAGYAPGMAAANERVLRMIDPKDAAPFLQKDLSVTLSTYIGQAVQRAEYTRRFGAKGEVLDHLMKQAKANGATPAQLDTAQKYIMAMEGTLGNDISMMNRKIQGGLMVYQNYRLLPLSLFSNLVDPFGIMVRGGSIKEAFTTLLRGFQEIGHEFGKGEPDALRRLAEDLGIIVDHSTMSSMGNLYNSQYFMGWQKKANDGLFKWNLMEGWNKSMRVGALKAGIGFVERHAALAARKKPDETSLRYLAELNLKPADVQLDRKGRLTNLDDEKIQQALYRWVDEAIMRPNASQRPIYGSDPHYMAIFHLKQFTYTFYKQIMGRAVHEAKHGNLAPAFVLLGYVPMMVAADAARGVVTGLLSGGGAPANPEQDSLWGTVEHGWERAGLYGPAQFGIDGVRAYQHGSIPFANMLGPSGEQAVELGEDLAHGDVARSLRRAPPGASVFDATMAAKTDD